MLIDGLKKKVQINQRYCKIIKEATDFGNEIMQTQEFFLMSENDDSLKKVVCVDSMDAYELVKLTGTMNENEFVEDDKPIEVISIMILKFRKEMLEYMAHCRYHRRIDTEC